MAVDNIEDFQALEPFFRVIETGLAGLVDGGHFFDLLAEDVVCDVRPGARAGGCGTRAAGR